jgi:phage repressor protein C with HTH and peptisase S24 domain
MPQSSIDLVLAQNLQAALNVSGKTAYAVAKSLGHAPNWLYRVINGEAGILLPTLREVAAELGVPVGSLVDPLDDRSAEVPDFVYVVEVEAVPGSGETKFDETFKRRIALPRALLEDISEDINSDSFFWRLVRIEGDSMAPTLPDGCLVMIDRLDREFQDEGIYVMVTEQELLVRRVRWDKNLEWVILNGETDPVEVTPVGPARVIGRVRRAWSEF